MNLIYEQFEFLKDFAKLIDFCEKKSFVITGGELYRPHETQEIYFKQGRSKTNNSYHQKRLAIDLNFFLDDRLIYDKSMIQEIGDFWESLNENNRWGGNFKSFIDTPHFERRIE